MNVQMETKLDFPLASTVKMNKLKKRGGREVLTSPPPPKRRRGGCSSESVLTEPLPDGKHLHVFRQELIYLAISYPQFVEL